MIEGLTSLDSSGSSMRMVGSRFALPPTFDTTRFASKWVEDGVEVDEARQDQIIASANMKAQGWEVFQTIDLEAAKKAGKSEEKPKMIPIRRVIGKRNFILMFRPKNLQQAVNKLYANESRDRLNREIVGESKAASSDPGVLTNQDLQRVSRSYGEDAPQPIPTGSGSQDPNRASELQLQ